MHDETLRFSHPEMSLLFPFRYLFIMNHFLTFRRYKIVECRSFISIRSAAYFTNKPYERSVYTVRGS